MKNPFSVVGEYVSKINNNRFVNAVDRFLEKPKRRFPASVLASILTAK